MEGEIPFLGNEVAPAYAAPNQNPTQPSKSIAAPAPAAPKTTLRMPVAAAASAPPFRMPVTAPPRASLPKTQPATTPEEYGTVRNGVKQMDPGQGGYGTVALY